MNVIFYSSTIDERTKAICRVLEHSGHNIGLELHHSISSLESRLSQPLNVIALVLLYVSSQEDLSDTIALKELLQNLPVILIMHETGKDTVKKARILMPRFVFGADYNLEDMGLVFERMLARKSSYGQQQVKTDALCGE